MPVSIPTWGASAVVAIQLVVPTVLAWRAWQVEDPRRSRAKEAATPSARTSSRDAGDRTPREHETRAIALRCTQCNSPVPLLAAAFPCPACGATNTPPAEYAGALRAAEATDRILVRAERVWSWSRVWTSLAIVWLGRLLLVGWLAVVIASSVVLSATWVAVLLPCAVIVAIVQCFIGFAFFGALRQMRDEIPPLPAGVELEAPPELGNCAGCGSPFAFGANRLSAVCGYCTAVQFRRALAADARRDAIQAAGEAQRSLLDGLRALETKRFELAGATVITGVAVVFYTVIFGIGALVDLF